MNRIDERFAALKKQGRAAVMPYLPLGYPTPEVSSELVRALEKAGADMLELGIPFSDPLADGPVIQHATQVALQNGTTLVKCLSMVRDARAAGVTIPLLLMGYYNPILRFGVERFAVEAKTAGADGLIVPDLPPEEAAELGLACERESLALVFLVAPTSTDERLRKVAAASRGFLYLVSLTGVTGMRDGLPTELGGLIRRARAFTVKPLCVGFGISNTATARQVGEMADGVIVGSALVSRIADPASALTNAREFVSGLREAVEARSRVQA